jgi:hypothetical protein
MFFSLMPKFVDDLLVSGGTVLGLIEGVAEVLRYGLWAVSGVSSYKF